MNGLRPHIECHEKVTVLAPVIKTVVGCELIEWVADTFNVPEFLDERATPINEDKNTPFLLKL